MAEDRATVGVDTGGTFTDFVLHDATGFRVLKVLSTPSQPEVAVLEGLKRLEHLGVGEATVVHGSTVATNALLERKGAKTAHIANRGLEDVVQIGRQNRASLYHLDYRRPMPLADKDLRFGIGGRVLSSGDVLEPLDDQEIPRLVATLKDLQVDSVSVCLLFSFLHPEHECRLGDLLQEAGIMHSLSHQVVGEFREFERASTTLVNAYVMPKTAGYLRRLLDRLAKGQTLSVMHSGGGRIGADVAMERPVRTILSGPAGGVVGALAIGQKAGFERLLTFDMGGTSTDVALLDGRAPLVTETVVDGFPLRVPTVDIHTVGAGGGSIARMDLGGALVVGPESAGAHPGPVCYGSGEEITVTDAHLYLGRLGLDGLLGGAMALDRARVEVRMAKLAKEAGLSGVALAEGILAVANATMERALRVVSVERGYNPADFALCCFGGAGGMHGVFLARLLGVPRVIVPPEPGTLSARGLLLSDGIWDYSKTVMISLEGEKERIVAKLDWLYQSLDREIGGANRQPTQLQQDVDLLSARREHLLEMRYRGQSHELLLPYDTEDPLERFHLEHQRRYGYGRRGHPVEVVNLRIRVILPTKCKPSPPIGQAPDEDPRGAVVGQREAIFDSEEWAVPVYGRGQLLAGHCIVGPAIVGDYSATTVLPPGAKAEVDLWGNLIVAP